MTFCTWLMWETARSVSFVIMEVPGQQSMAILRMHIPTLALRKIMGRLFLRPISQESPVFTGLTPGTNYVFFQRDKDVKMPSAGLVVTTLKSIVDAPEAPIILGLSDTTITIQYNSDCEYAICEAKDLSAEIEWQDKETFKGEFTGLLPAREYYIYCRYSETDMTYASKLSAAAKERTDKTTTDAIPEIPVILFKNSSSITLVPVPGCEIVLFSCCILFFLVK